MLIRSLSLSAFFLASHMALAQNSNVSAGKPPFHGTIFLNPNIITSNDPTSFLSLEPTGQGIRQMFDRRVNNWVELNAFLYNVTFDDGLSTEIQVNPEFGNTLLAQKEAQKYAWVIGQLPTTLRQDVKTVWIHKGTELFGGGNNNLLIHTGQTELYEKDGILEETLIHEATHTSLDSKHAQEVEWQRAQLYDRMFISSYAQENPKREDLAETFLLFIGLHLRGDRMSDELKHTIENTIPYRLQYLASQDWNFYPLEGSFKQTKVPLEQEVEIVPDPETKPEEEIRLPVGQLNWVTFDGMIPENSVSGGHENGSDLLVCRGYYRGASHPGKLLSNKCNIGWGGLEIELTDFQILINKGSTLYWIPYTGNIPTSAIEAGNENGKILYVGQITRPDGSVQSGKVFGTTGNFIFNYGYGGQEITEKRNFRILVKH